MSWADADWDDPPAPAAKTPEADPVDPAAPLPAGPQPAEQQGAPDQAPGAGQPGAVGPPGQDPMHGGTAYPGQVAGGQAPAPGPAAAPGGAPAPGSAPYPGQPYPGQQYPGRQYPGHPYAGQPYPGQAAMPGQAPAQHPDPRAAEAWAHPVSPAGGHVGYGPVPGAVQNPQIPTTLSSEIARSDPRNPDYQMHLLTRIRDMRTGMPANAHSDLAANLNMAGMLTQYLVRMGGIGPEDVLQIVARLVSEVEMATADMSPPPPAPPPPAATQPPEVAQPPEAGQPVRKKNVVLHMDHASTGGLSLVGGSAHGGGRLLGEVIIQLGFASRAQVEEALRTQKATGVRLGEALVANGVASWGQIKKAIAVQKQFKG